MTVFKVLLNCVSSWLNEKARFLKVETELPWIFFAKIIFFSDDIKITCPSLNTLPEFVFMSVLFCLTLNLMKSSETKFLEWYLVQLLEFTSCKWVQLELSVQYSVGEIESFTLSHDQHLIGLLEPSNKSTRQRKFRLSIKCWHRNDRYDIIFHASKLNESVCLPITKWF